MKHWFDVTLDELVRMGAIRPEEGSLVYRGPLGDLPIVDCKIAVESPHPIAPPDTLPNASEAAKRAAEKRIEINEGTLRTIRREAEKIIYTAILEGSNNASLVPATRHIIRPLKQSTIDSVREVDRYLENLGYRTVLTTEPHKYGHGGFDIVTWTAAW